MLKKSLLLSLFSWFCLVGFGQDEDLDQLFEDYSTDVSLQIKYNLSAQIIGDMTFSVEPNLPGRYTIELGAGILMPYYFPEIHYIHHWPDFPIGKVNGGFSAIITGKIFKDETPEGVFYGVGYRFRNYNDQNTAPLRLHDIYFTYGIQGFFNDFLGYEASAGIGGRVSNRTNSNNDYNYPHFIYPIFLKISYYL